MLFVKLCLDRPRRERARSGARCDERPGPRQTGKPGPGDLGSQLQVKNIVFEISSQVHVNLQKASSGSSRTGV